jgi:hypothetical protein
MRFSFILMLTFFLALNSVRASEFSENLKTAQALLKECPQGKATYKMLQGGNPGASPIEVSVSNEPGASLGRVEETENQNYRIVVSGASLWARSVSKASARRLADTLTHELKHISLQIELSKYLELHPEQKDRFGYLSMSKNALAAKAYLVEHPQDTATYLKFLFFHEQKAYAAAFEMSDACFGPPHIGLLAGAALRDNLAGRYKQFYDFSFGEELTAIWDEMKSHSSLADYLTKIVH